MHSKCSAITKAGKACNSKRLPGRPYCFSHDPDRADERADAQRRGGLGKSDARRSVRTWAAFGRELDDDDLPAILKSCLYAVKCGEMSPGEATAICQLARAAVQITGDLKLESRIIALEQSVEKSLGRSR